MIVGREICNGARQRNLTIVGRGEVEGGGEISGDGAAPLGDVVLLQAGMLRSEALFNELNERGVVEDLRVDPATFAPGGHDDHRHALTQAVGTGGVLGVAREDFIGGVDGRYALCTGLRRGRRRHVIEEAVVLVVHEEEGSLAPDVGVGSEDVEDLGHIPCAIVRGPVGMFGIGLRRDEPGDLRQVAGAYILLEDVEERAAGLDVGSGSGPFGKGRALRCVLILVEVEERVVSVVADIGIVGPSPEPACIQAYAAVLIDLPGDAGVLQKLRVGRPVVAGFGVVDDRAAVLAVVADPACPHVVAVGIGWSEQRAVVGIADSERIGQREVERNIAAGQMRHRCGAFLGTH